jgi:hypothetical protein
MMVSKKPKVRIEKVKPKDFVDGWNEFEKFMVDAAS